MTYCGFKERYGSFMYVQYYLANGDGFSIVLDKLIGVSYDQETLGMVLNLEDIDIICPYDYAGYQKHFSRIKDGLMRGDTMYEMNLVFFDFDDINSREDLESAFKHYKSIADNSRANVGDEDGRRYILGMSL